MYYDYKDIYYEDENFTKAVERMTDMEVIELHPSCKIIGDATFHNLFKLKKFEVPSSVEEIEIEAFESCENLTSLKFNEGLKKIGPYAFSSCFFVSGKLILPDSLEEVESGAFSCCSTISELDIGAGLKVLNSNVFAGCSSLKKIDLRNVEVLHTSCFTNLEIENILLPFTLTEIDPFAFNMCKIDKIVYQGSQAQLMKLTGGEEFYNKFKNVLKFEIPTLDMLIDAGKSMTEANEYLHNSMEDDLEK